MEFAVTLSDTDFVLGEESKEWTTIIKNIRFLNFRVRHFGVAVHGKNSSLTIIRNIS